MYHYSDWVVFVFWLKYRENYLAAQSLFVSFCLTPISLVTELVPYLAKLSNPMRNQGNTHTHTPCILTKVSL